MPLYGATDGVKDEIDGALGDNDEEDGVTGYNLDGVLGNNDQEDGVEDKIDGALDDNDHVWDGVDMKTLDFPEIWNYRCLSDEEKLFWKHVF